MQDDDRILNDLKKMLPFSNQEKSSYWHHYIDKVNFNYYDKKLTSQFGTYSKKHYLKNLLHHFFQIIIYGISFLYLPEFRIYKSLCKKENRNIDQNVVRHIFTLNVLNKHNLIKDTVCVIGDGKTNCVGGLIELHKKDIRIFSINLPEILINDYIIIKDSKLIKNELIIAVQNEEDLKRKDKKLFFISASNADFLFNQSINLFINIASMQEMKKTTIKKYFDIISNNKSYFYCCNRELKILPDGEKIIFNNYPWGKGKIIFKEDCCWHQKYYDFFPPFIKKYDGNIVHSLTKY